MNASAENRRLARIINFFEFVGVLLWSFWITDLGNIASGALSDLGLAYVVVFSLALVILYLNLLYLRIRVANQSEDIRDINKKYFISSTILTAASFIVFRQTALLASFVFLLVELIIYSSTKNVTLSVEKKTIKTDAHRAYSKPTSQPVLLVIWGMLMIGVTLLFKDIDEAWVLILSVFGGFANLMGLTSLYYKLYYRLYWTGQSSK